MRNKFVENVLFYLLIFICFALYDLREYLNEVHWTNNIIGTILGLTLYYLTKKK